MKQLCPICKKEYYMRDLAEQVINDFPEDKESWIKQECPNVLTHCKIMRAEEVAKIPKEIKQKFLDLIHQNKTIGQSREEVNISLDAAMGVLEENMEHYSILRTEAK